MKENNFNKYFVGETNFEHDPVIDKVVYKILVIRLIWTRNLSWGHTQFKWFFLKLNKNVGKWLVSEPVNQIFNQVRAIFWILCL